MSERREHERVVNSIINIVYQRVDRDGDLEESRRDECVKDITEILEAFAKEQQIKGMEAAAHDLLNRMRQAKESGPCTIQAVRVVTVDHMGWIEDQIAKLKEGG